MIPRRARLPLAALFGAGTLALWSGSGQQTGPPASDPIALRARALTLAAAGDAEALPALREAVGVNPQDSYLWRALGRTAARRDRHDEAVQALEAARRLGTFAPGEAALEIARVHAAAGRRAETLRWIAQALDDRRCCRADLLRDEAFATLRADPEFQRLAAAPVPGLDRAARWQADLDVLVEEAQRMHVGPDRPAHGYAFRSRADVVRAGIPGWTDARIVVEFQRLLAMLGDGHSFLMPGSGPAGIRYLPVDLYWFEEGVFVVGDDESGDLVGREVRRIGGRPVLEVLQDLAVYVSRDNDQGLRAAAGSVLTTVPCLETLGLVRGEGVRMETVDAGGRLETRVLTGVPRRFRARLPPPAGVRDVPRYLRPGPPFETERLTGAALYVNFRAVADGPGETLAAFGHRLRADLAQDDIRTVIVDVRMNSGGNSFLFNQLVRTLVHFEQEGGGRRLFVLIGRHTFSAAQNFIAVLDRWTDAIFVGEPSGSRPNFTGESSPFRLPHSGLAGTISTRNHQNADWEDRRVWIAPELPVPPAAADYFAGRDAALEAVLERIR